MKLAGATAHEPQRLHPALHVAVAVRLQQQLPLRPGQPGSGRATYGRRTGAAARAAAAHRRQPGGGLGAMDLGVAAEAGRSGRLQRTVRTGGRGQLEHILALRVVALGDVEVGQIDRTAWFRAL